MSEDFDRGWLAIFCPALLIDDEQREYILILLVVVDLKSIFSLELPWYCFDVTYMHVNLYLNVPLLLSVFLPCKCNQLDVKWLLLCRPGECNEQESVRGNTHCEVLQVSGYCCLLNVV